MTISAHPLVRVLAESARGHKRGLVAVLTTSALGALTPPLVVSLTGLAVSAVSTAIMTADPGAAAEASRLGITLVLVATVGPLLSLVSTYLVNRIQLDLIRRLRLQLTQKCADLSLSQLESPSIRDSQQLASDSLASAAGPVLTDTVGVLGSLVSLVTLSGLMISWDPFIALLVVAAPVPALLGSLFYSQIGWQIEVGRVDRVRFAEYVRELLSDRLWLPEIRLLAVDRRLFAVFTRELAAFMRQDTIVLRRRWLASMLLVGVASGMTAAAYLLAIFRSLDAANVGWFAGFMVGAAAVQGVCQQLFAGAAGLYSHRFRLGDLFGFLDTPGARDPAVGPSIPEPPGIAFEDVWFTYPSEESPTIQGLSFEIAPGEVVGLAGPNGSGKSTVMKLLLGVYHPDRGRILINGRELALADGQFAPGSCSALFQQQVQFVGTVRDNITACQAKDSVDDSRLWAILDEIGLEPRIRSLADGLDAPLGREFGGSELSIGEWQRIALARALHHGGSVLILDEPTSAADRGAVAALGHLLRHGKRSATTVLISHDAEILRYADRQLSLESGCLTCSSAVPQESNGSGSHPLLAGTFDARRSSHNRRE